MNIATYQISKATQAMGLNGAKFPSLKLKTLHLSYYTQKNVFSLSKLT